MRALAAGERDLLGGARITIHSRLETQDVDGVWHTSVHNGFDFFDEADWGANPDDAVMSATFTLRRKAGTVSIAPLIGASPVNRDAADAYAPLYAENAKVRYYTATVAGGAAPMAGDWHRVFDGKIDTVDSAAGRSTIALHCRDIGAYLQMLYIDDKDAVYGTVAGRPIQLVLQDMIDAWWDMTMGPKPIVVFPVDPVANIGQFKPGAVPLMDALRELAARIGYVIRMEWGAGDTMELRLWRPGNKADSDATFANTEYLSLTELQVSDADIRNAIIVRGFTAGAVPIQAAAVDGASLFKYGRRRAIFQEDDKSPLDTVPELQRLADAARDDLSTPYATHKIETLYFWPVERGDRHTYVANADHYDSDQILYVTQYNHHVGRGTGRTTIQARGKPVSRYFEWFAPSSAPASGSNVQVPDLDIKLVSSSPTSATYSPVATIPDGQALTLTYGYGDDTITTPIANGGSIVVPRSTNASDDRLLRVMVVAANGLRTIRSVTVDYDTAPGMGVSTERQPIFDGTVQTGWRIRGTVDDDTRTLVCHVEGDLGFLAVSPLTGEAVVAGDHWLDTSTTKTWQIDVAQGPGGAGKLTLTPYEFSPLSPGLGLSGKPMVVELARAAITSHQVRELGSTLRAVTLSVNPPLATNIIVYSRDGESWTEHAGPSVTITVDVEAQERTIDYFSRSASGVIEETKHLTIDLDHKPSVTSMVLTEEQANQLLLALGVDDDTAYIRIWARRGSSPIVDGQPQEQYLRYSGTPDRLSFPFRASGNGDVTSTWYVVVRVYDDAWDFVQDPVLAVAPAVEAFTEGRNKKLVTGPGAPAVGSLSNVQVARVVESGSQLHDITWNHNQTVQDTAHTVTIRENGVQIVTARDARLEHTNAAAVALVGGYHLLKGFANPGDTGAQFLTFNYEIDLKLGATILATYTQSVSGWYAGGGEPPPPAPPPEIPNTPVADSWPGYVRATWTNTSTAWPIRIIWQKLVGGVWIDQNTGQPGGPTQLPAGTTTHNWVAPTQSAFFRAKVAYFSGDLIGTYSTPSNGALPQ